MTKKKTAGRPRKADPRLKANGVTVVPSLEEKDLWTRAAERADRNRSDWMRITCNEAAKKLLGEN